MAMPTEEAWDASERLVTDEGLFIGHSAGAAVAGAQRLAAEHGPGACVVTILPDRGERYFGPLRWERSYVW
jgi:cysteine synthase B